MFLPFLTHAFAKSKIGTGDKSKDIEEQKGDQHLVHTELQAKSATQGVSPLPEQKRENEVLNSNLEMIVGTITCLFKEKFTLNLWSSLKKSDIVAKCFALFGTAHLNLQHSLLKMLRAFVEYGVRSLKFYLALCVQKEDVAPYVIEHDLLRPVFGSFLELLGGKNLVYSAILSFFISVKKSAPTTIKEHIVRALRLAKIFNVFAAGFQFRGYDQETQGAR